MSYPTYQAISQATEDLRKAPKILDRRNAAAELKKLLTERHVRVSLAEEAVNAAREQKGPSPEYILRKAYSNAIKSALHAASLTLRSKTSKKNEDVALPFKIFSIVDKDSDATIALLKKEFEEKIDECEPFTFESFDRYRGTNANLTLVSAKELKELLKFCLDCLEDEEVCELAEADLVNMLQKLCSRPDYVTNFHPHDDVLNIMTAVQSILRNDKVGGTSSVNAAKAFFNLFHQLTINLNIDISNHIQLCIALIVDWVRRCMSRTSSSADSSQIAKFMYSVVADVLATYPEHCIAVLKVDNFGRDLFRHARKRWTTLRGVDREVLVSYFSSYLYVCEMAGNIQGLFPGDLGDIGSATLDGAKLEQLKTMLLSENNLEAFSSMSISQDSTSTQRRPFDRNRIDLKRRKTGAGVVQEQFTPLPRPARKYLELCGRVLRCLQRLHLATTEQSSTSDLTNYLVEQCVDGSSRGLGSCQKGLSSKSEQPPLSPFVETVAKACFGPIVSGEVRETTSIEYMSASPIESESINLSQAASEPNSKTDQSKMLLQLPMLMLLHGNNCKDLDDSKLIVYLQLLAAFAEMFPCGDCWASSNSWYETDFSPLDWNGEECLGVAVSYCNACTTTDMAAIVYSLSLILARYGDTSGSPQVQMWTLTCLLKMTDASHISSRYSRESTDDIDALAMAWRSVWDRILQTELRYHSSTVQANSHSLGVGEFVIMLLTEIVKGGLTDSKCSGAQAYPRIEQDKIWSLPVFSTALDLRSSAPFELASVVIRCTGLVEGDAGTICSRGLDPFLQNMFKLEAEGGRERHFRLAHYCVQFISQAVKNGDQESIRRISPYMSNMFCVLLDTECVKLTSCTSYALTAYRELKFTDTVFDPRYLEGGERKDAENHLLLWEESIYPFQYQYVTEQNHSMWNKLDHRGNLNCPYFSLSDRVWLSKTFLCNVPQRGSTRCNMQTGVDLKEYGLKNMLLVLGHSAHDDDFKSKSNDLPLLSKVIVIKVALSLAVTVCGDDALKMKSYWISLEHFFHSIVQNVIEEMDRSSSDANFAITLVEIVGIIRLIRSLLSIDESPTFISGILPIKLCEDLYKSCKRVVQSCANVAMPGMKRSEERSSKRACIQNSSDDDLFSDGRKRTAAASRNISTFSRSSESELDDFDSDNAARRLKKRKHAEKHVSNGGQHTISNDHQSAAHHDSIDSKTAWVCSFIMTLLDPSLASANVIADSLLWPHISEHSHMLDPNEPHNYLLFVGLICRISYDDSPVESSEKDSAQSPMLSLIVDALTSCRELATNSSPMHMWGFGTCETLVAIGLSNESDVDSVLSVLDPKSSSELKDLKNRPILRYLQVRAATKCFVSGCDKFHRYFEDTFAKAFVMTSLRDQNSLVRRAGIEALGAALRLFPKEYHMKIAMDALYAFPPKPTLNNDLFQSRQSSKDKDNHCKSFDEWVNEKVEGADFQDLKKMSWKRNRLAVEADKMRCIGAIGVNTGDDKVVKESICAILVLSGDAKRRFLAFSVLENIAKGRQYASIEKILREQEMHLIDYWMNIEEPLLSLPVALTLPSLVRGMLRLNVCASSEDRPKASTFCEEALFRTAAEEYVYQKSSIIIPQLFITHMDLSEDIKKILTQANKASFIIPEERNFVWDLVEEIANICAEGALKPMIKSHFYQIYARIVPLLILESDHEEVSNSYHDAQKLLNSFSILFKDVKAEVSKCSELIVLELINLDMKWNLVPNNSARCDDTLQKSIKYVMNAVSSDSGGSFKALSISATECILYARTLLHNIDHPKFTMRAWETMEVIIGMVQSSKSDGNELEFAIGSLISMFSGTVDEGLRFAVLTKIKIIWDDLARATPEETCIVDVTTFLNETTSCLIQMHEQCQLRLIEYLQQSRRRHQIHKRSFLPLFKTNADRCALQDIMFNEESPEDSTSYGLKYCVPEAIIDCTALTYDIIAVLLNPGAAFSEIAQRTIDPFPESEMGSNTLKALSEINRKCSLRDLLNLFDKTRTDQTKRDLKEKLKTFLTVASTFRTGIGAKLLSSESAANRKNRSSLPPEVRSFLSALNRLQSDVQSYVQVRKIVDGEVLGLLILLRKDLLSLCSKAFHTEVQVAATKCVGEFGILCEDIEIPEMAPLERPETFASDPLAGTHSSAFSLLSTMLQSDNIDTANHAKDTIKAILSTSDGCNSWDNHPIPAECKRILAPFSNTSRRDKPIVDMPDMHFKKLLTIANKSEQEVKTDRSWCWQDDFWTLPEENHLFEDWIKNLVCAIIICCYETKVGGEGTKNTALLKGESDFFPACLSMSAMNHEFAAIIFPGIIYDILETDSGDNYEESYDLEHPKVRKYMVGGAFSLANQTLSRCFGSILGLFTMKGQSDQKFVLHASALQALDIIVGTLDNLRVITEHRFLGLNTKKTRSPALSSIKGRKAGRSVPDELYNNVPPSPLWRGRPYGVVLHLTGTELAQAYAASKDFLHALYYAELYADNRLGSSGNTFERLDELKVIQTSLSGFGLSTASNVHFGGMPGDIPSKSDLALSLHRVFQNCLSELHEDEALAGLDEQTSSIRFDDPTINMETHHFNSITGPSEAMTELMSLDVIAQSRISSNPIHDRLAISSGLNQLGMRDVSRYYLRGTCAAGLIRSEVEYKKLEEEWAEQSWRLTQWDQNILTPVEKNTISSRQSDAFCLPLLNGTRDNKNYVPGYHSSLQKTVSSIMDDDFTTFALNLSASRLSLLNDFHDNVGTNAPAIEISAFSLKSCTLNQLEDLGSVCSGSMPTTTWIQKYRADSSIYRNPLASTARFSDLECSMVAHEIFLKVMYHRYGVSAADEIGTHISEHMLSMCSIAREKQRPNIASSALNRLRQFSQANHLDHEEAKRHSFHLRCSFEDAKIAQCLGNTTSAVRSCKEIIKRLKTIQNRTDDENVLLIETQLQSAEWLISHPIESNATILIDLLKPAATYAWQLHTRKQVKSGLVASTNFSLGNFAANLYDSVQKRVNSHEWKLLSDAARGRQSQLQDLENFIITKEKKKENDSEYNAARHEYTTLTREVRIDTKEREAVEQSVMAYLYLALDAYGRALSSASCDSDCSRHVFRLISLWFRNCSHEIDDVHEKVCSWLPSIPSYHFVPLAYQIFSRIDTASDNSQFQSVLQNLVCKICIEHPYHGLVQIVALANGNNVANSTKESIFTQNVGKVTAVKKLMKRIKSSGSVFVAELLDSYCALAEAYITLAMMPTKELVASKKTKNIPFSSMKSIPRDLELTRCLESRNLHMPCVLTNPPQVRPDANYGNGDTDPIGSERILSYEATFSLTDSGLHRPKIVICKGSQGGVYKELVKGDDDIRQDAVMQQVFSSMNVFLRNQKQQTPNDRNLRLVTYNCIPLSPAAGVLQWVDETIAIGHYLTTPRSGAHDRYYPGEWSNLLCRQHMTNCPQTAKRVAFDEVCKHFSPAFRFFFLERFSYSPQLWYTARMAYTRSCAVNSFVGHILGIGDRHTQNILIKESTGELVHIDFGIVFEQGKVLPTPEKIPFRLTRDMIDGMGPMGTEGAFTSAARATTKVLRENSSALLTVLSAVVSDPLYKWNVSTAKGRQLQRDVSSIEENEDDSVTSFNKKPPENNATLSIVESDNDAATRAVARIHEKLKGYEEGTLGEQQTIEGQVRFLINEARNADHLSSIFIGWGAWI